MLLEYVSRKISRLRWINKRSQENVMHHANTDADQLVSTWMCGTYSETLNGVSLWTNNGQTRDYTLKISEDNLAMKKHDEVHVNADVTQITPLTDKDVLVCLSNGSASLFGVDKLKLTLGLEWPSLHSESCTDAALNHLKNKVITCGQDGVITQIDLEKPLQVVKSPCLTQCSLECLDLISPEVVMLGTSSGHLKLYDVRQKKISMTLKDVQSVITCLSRNPNSSHIIACANDAGLMSLWDLRNEAKQLMQISAHNSFISELKFLSNEANNMIMTCSYDGQLLRWNISSNSQLTHADSLIASEGASQSALNSFDVNVSNEIIISSDNEVLFYSHL